MPQPVDLHTEVARVFATERIQQVADRASLAAQQRTAIEVQEDQLTQETQIAETQETESEQVDADERRQEEAQRRQRRQHLPGDADESAEERSAAGLAEGEGQRLDVTI